MSAAPREITEVPESLVILTHDIELLQTLRAVATEHQISTVGAEADLAAHLLDDHAGVAVLEQLIAQACVTGKRLWLVSTTGNGTVLGQPRALLIGEYGRLRSLATAPDGSLWVGTSNQERGGEPAPEDDRIIRLVFSDGGAGRS